MRKKFIILTGFISETPYDKIKGDMASENLLEDKVNEKINEGYYPFGNLVPGNGNVAYQAMMLENSADGKPSLDVD